ncbi:MAG: DNA mismatch endonuclease Vsr [Desulfovibrio sp.]|jgi:DNA mismatch endonuclease (patch repair protein)|nr:DNA mismatch endonuclease Vsr [Desulfovibrio sp.]
MDTVSAETRSRNMSRIKGRDTQPEKTVRSLLHSMGCRFRLHVKNLPGKPDIVLPRRKSVIFVHGCFWHGHPGCRRASIPATRTDFWAAKIRGNRLRDEQSVAALEKLGYRCLVVWQCQLRDKAALGRLLADFLNLEDAPEPVSAG